MEKEFKSLRDYIASSQRQRARLEEIVAECEAKGNKEEAEHYAERSKAMFIEIQALQKLQADLDTQIDKIMDKFRDKFTEYNGDIGMQFALAIKMGEDIKKLICEDKD